MIRITRRFQFGLRTLLVVVACAAASLGWWCWGAHEQTVAAEAFQRCGGYVAYDWSETHFDSFGFPYARNGEAAPPVPDWLAWAYDQHYLGSITGFEVCCDYELQKRGRPVSSISTLKGVFPRVNSLKWLYLSQMHLSSADFDAIWEARQIEALGLKYMNVSDAEVKQLVSFRDLKFLSLEATKITDQAMESLVTLPALEELSLAYTDVTDQGLDTLLKAPRLRDVLLMGTKVTEAARDRFDAELKSRRLSRE